MTAGVLSAGPIYPASSGFNAGALDTRIAIAQPFGARVIGGELYGAHTASLPIAVTHFTRTGYRGLTFALDNWYFRIQVIPGQLSLGNVVANEVFSVGVWNAWLDRPQTLSNIVETDVEGIVLSGQSNPPLVFARNQYRVYTVSVSPLGPPNITAVITWQFDDAESVTTVVTGSRITAWTLTPDWSTDILEKLAWKTDVLRAWSGKEQRRQLRIAPRRIVSFATLMQNAEKQFTENQMFAWGALTWALPIWWDGQRLSAKVSPGDTVVPADTVSRDFQANGGLAILITDARTYEVIQIQSTSSSQLALQRPVLGTWVKGTRLYPLRAARLMTVPRLQRIHGGMAQVSPEFTITEPCDWPEATGLPMYRGLPVLEDSQDVSDLADASYDRETYVIDNETGSIDVVDTALLGFPINTHRWFMKGRAARAALRALLYTLKGQLTEIWVPTYDADLTLAIDTSSGQTAIHVVNSGYTQFANVQNRRDLRFELKNGTIFYRRITGSAIESADLELLSLDGPMPSAIPISSIRRISFMPLSRLAGDEVTIAHAGMIDGIATSEAAFRAVNHDV